MCGRYTLCRPERVTAEFRPDRVLAGLGRPRYNIAPMQKVPALAVLNGERVLADFQWGFVPRWADDPAAGSRMINARSESVAVKPSFRDALRRARCLIPADGFYEWRKAGAAKRPVYIQAEDQGLFAFAGLYAAREQPGAGSLISCVIITAEADSFMRPVHDRMPVILPPGSRERWIDPELTDAGAALDILRAPRGMQMRMTAVSNLVNSPANDDARCIAAAVEEDRASGVERRPAGGTDSLPF